MKKALSLLVLLLNLVSYSYGMSGELFYDLDDMPGTSFNFERTQQQEERERQKRRREKEEDTEISTSLEQQTFKRPATGPRISLSPLRVLHQQEIPLSSDDPNSKPGESNLEQLPLEVIADYITSRLSLKDLQNMALVSKKCKQQAQFSISHLDVLIANITPEKVTELACQFPNIKSIYVKGSGITAEQIRLLGEKFPKLESLNLWATRISLEEAKALATPGLFTSLKNLDVSFNNLKDAGLEVLTQASFADNLEYLNLTGNRLTKKSIQIAANSGKFKSLKKLRLAYNDIFDGIEDLSQAIFANTLTLLDLGRTYLTEADIQALIKPGSFTSLKELYLNKNDLSSESSGNRTKLEQASFASTLEVLDLSQTNLGLRDLIKFTSANAFKALKKLYLKDNGAYWLAHENVLKRLAEATFASQLEELSLTLADTDSEEAKLKRLNEFKSLRRLSLYNGGNAGDNIVKILEQAPFANQLEALNLGISFSDRDFDTIETVETPITGEAANILAHSGKFKNIKHLALSYHSSNHKPHGILGILAQAPFAAHLESFIFAGTNVTEEDMRILAQPGTFNSLKKLDLSRSTLNDKGMEILATAPFANQLEELNISDTYITNNSMWTLAQSNTFTRLKWLDISYNKAITDTGIKYLEQAPFAQDTLEVLEYSFSAADLPEGIPLNKFLALKRNYN